MVSKATEPLFNLVSFQKFTPMSTNIYLTSRRLIPISRRSVLCMIWYANRHVVTSAKGIWKELITLPSDVKNT